MPAASPSTSRRRRCRPAAALLPLPHLLLLLQFVHIPLVCWARDHPNARLHRGHAAASASSSSSAAAAAAEEWVRRLERDLEASTSHTLTLDPPTIGDGEEAERRLVETAVVGFPPVARLLLETCCYRPASPSPSISSITDSSDSGSIVCRLAARLQQQQGHKISPGSATAAVVQLLHQVVPDFYVSIGGFF